MDAVCGYASGAGEGPAGAKPSEVTLRQGCEGCERPLRRRDAVLGASARTVRSLQSEASRYARRSLEEPGRAGGAHQGHLAILDGASGKLLQVWNSLCSNRAGLIRPGARPQSRSAIWGRAGPVIDPGDGRIFIATGNGDWNGTTDWGDALIELDSAATAATSGRRIATLACGPGHWNSPIVVDGRIILPEGDANSRATRGVLDIRTLPGS